MVPHKLKRNDTAPMQIVLDFSDGSLEPNLSSAISITFFMWPSASDLYVPDETLVVKATGGMTVVNEAAAIVQYAFTAADTDTKGFFAAEVEVVDSAGIRKTFPAGGYFPILIGFDLGQG